MQRDYTIVVSQKVARTSFIHHGFLHCTVTSTMQPEQKRTFVYCFHCKRLRAFAWFFRHRNDEGVRPSEEDVTYYQSRLVHYQRDIETEVELLHLSEKLFIQRHEDPSAFPTPTHKRFRTTNGRRSPSPDLVHCPLEDEDVRGDGNEAADENEETPFSIASTVETISESFEQCFQDFPLELARFASLSDLFFL